MKTDQPKWSRAALHAVLIFASALLLYAVTLGYPFHFDDEGNILSNPGLKDARALLDQEYGQGFGVTPLMARIHQARPLSYLSFRLSYITGGLDPLHWRLINILLHASSSLLLYALLRLYLRQQLGPDWQETERSHAALLAAMLFVLHPLATESVIYISQRTNLLAAFFYLGSMTAYAAWRLRTRQGQVAGGYYILALLLGAASMLSKEIGATLPFALALMEYTMPSIGDKLPRPATGGCREVAWDGRERVLWVLPFFALALLVPLRLMAFEISQGADPLEAAAAQTALMPETSRYFYLVTQIVVVAKYIAMLLWPAGQNVDHYYMPETTAFSLRALGSLLLLSSLLVAAYFSLQKGRLRQGPLQAAGFLLGAFFLALLVECSVFPLKEMMVEYRTYLPGAFLLSALSVLLVYSLAWAAKSPGRRVAALGLLVIVIAWPLGLAAKTYLRQMDWTNGATLWKASLEQNPSNPRALNNLGLEYIKLGKVDEAIKLIERSLELQPRYHKSLSNLSVLYARRGRFEEAEAGYQKSLKIDPRDPDTYINYGLLALKTRRPGLALELYGRAAALEPGYLEAHKGLAQAHFELGNTVAAEAEKKKVESLIRAR